MVIGVVAYRVLHERVAELKRHALTKTWLEVIMPNKEELCEVSDSYRKTTEELNSIDFANLGLNELNKDTITPNRDHIC